MEPVQHIHPVTSKDADSVFQEYISGGWVCGRRLQVVGWCSVYWIVHHRSHNEWCGQGSGTQVCRGWWGIWDGDCSNRRFLPEGYMKKYEVGKGSKRRLLIWMQVHDFDYSLDNL